MIIEECPHCITSIIFKVDGTCPACGKSRFILPQKSREKILNDQDKAEMERVITYYKKNGTLLLIGGILLVFAIVVVIIVTLLYSPVSMYWSGAVLAGVAMVAKGHSQITHARELKLVYDRKYKSRY